MINLFLALVFLVLVSLNLIFVAKTVFKYKVNRKLMFSILMPYILLLLFKGIVKVLGYDINDKNLEIWDSIVEAVIFNLMFMICSIVTTTMFSWLDAQSENLNFNWMKIVTSIFLILTFGGEQYSILFSN